MKRNEAMQPHQERSKKGCKRKTEERERDRGGKRAQHVKELRTKGFINKVKDGKVRKEHWNEMNERSESRDRKYDMKMEIELSLSLEMEHDFSPAPPLPFFR